MAAINVDMKKIKNANYNLPSMISSIDTQKRYVNMLKWRIPSEIQDRRGIRERLNSVSRELDKAQQMLSGVYNVTGSAMTQYANMEKTLTENAARFE